MSKELIEKYSDILLHALKSKDYAPLMEIFAESFEARAKLMGRAYHFQERNKFEQFLNTLPGNLSIDLKSINTIEEQTYHLMVKMGMGLLKIPSTWVIQLDNNEKITYFEIK